MKHINLTDGNVRVLASDGFDGVYKKYTVVKGDTLWELSQKFGTTVKCLADVNEIPNPDLIEVDQVLLVPAEPQVPVVEKTEEVKKPNKSVIGAAGGLFKIINSDGFDGLYEKYKVVRGDTLGEIAKKFETTVEFLAKVNDIENVNLIEVDQTLYIPAKEEEKPVVKINIEEKTVE